MLCSIVNGLLIVGTTFAAINGRAGAPARCAHDDAALWHSVSWFRTTAPVARGVALLVHGLNQDPAALNPMAVELNNMGIDVLRLDLRGHGGNYRSRAADLTRLEALAEVSADVWLHDALCAYDEARLEADADRVPVFLVAFSLGALVGTELLSAGPETVRFERMVLLAPAIRTRWYVRAVRALSPWPELRIPSVAPVTERANDATPVAAYEALFVLEERLRSPDRQRLDVPTLVIMDEEDELVSAADIRAMIAEHGLHRWTGVGIRKSDPAADDHRHHAVTRAEHVGRATWADMIARIRSHLLGP